MHQKERALNSVQRARFPHCTLDMRAYRPGAYPEQPRNLNVTRARRKNGNYLQLPLCQTYEATWKNGTAMRSYCALNHFHLPG